MVVGELMRIYGYEFCGFLRDIFLVGYMVFGSLIGLVNDVLWVCILVGRFCVR